jgi:hypothetical protein
MRRLKRPLYVSLFCLGIFCLGDGMSVLVLNRRRGEFGESVGLSPCFQHRELGFLKV